jgi:ubiquinone/menaquinone biosynthesis C-methylase UbiE
VSRDGQIRFLSATAPLYDPTVGALGFRRLWQDVASVAAPRSGALCLDACTGTGGVALALADRGARVVGIDLATGLLARAERKARSAGLGARTRWLRMDARRLAWPDGSFPLVTCCMALHEMAEEERGLVLSELRRVSCERVVVAEYRVPSAGAARAWFRLARCFEYWESDDFGGFVARGVAARLEAAGLRVGAPLDSGAYRIWPCQVAEPRGAVG